MTPQSETIVPVTPPHSGWVFAMPDWMAEVVGVPEGTPVTLFAESGSVSVQMDAVPERAPRQESGWIIKMPPEMTEQVGVPEGSLVVLYAKPGRLAPEIVPPMKPDLKAIVQRIIVEDKEVFEEMKRLGD